MEMMIVVGQNGNDDGGRSAIIDRSSTTCI